MRWQPQTPSLARKARLPFSPLPLSRNALSALTCPGLCPPSPKPLPPSTWLQGLWMVLCSRPTKTRLASHPATRCDFSARPKYKAYAPCTPSPLSSHSGVTIARTRNLPFTQRFQEPHFCFIWHVTFSQAYAHYLAQPTPLSCDTHSILLSLPTISLLKLCTCPKVASKRAASHCSRGLSLQVVAIPTLAPGASGHAVVPCHLDPNKAAQGPLQPSLQVCGGLACMLVCKVGFLHVAGSC